MPARPPGDDWVTVTEDPVPVAEVVAWAIRPGCGALVTFCGTVRDHSEGRTGIVALEYEAYLEQVAPRLARVAAAARGRWTEIGRLGMVHRVGRLEVGEISVIVAVSTPHRDEAFAAARFCIDTVKETVPIWKRELWPNGSGWARCSHEPVESGTRTDTTGAADAPPGAGDPVVSPGSAGHA